MVNHIYLWNMRFHPLLLHSFPFTSSFWHALAFVCPRKSSQQFWCVNGKAAECRNNCSLLAFRPHTDVLKERFSSCHFDLDEMACVFLEHHRPGTIIDSSVCHCLYKLNTQTHTLSLCWNMAHYHIIFHAHAALVFMRPSHKYIFLNVEC
jgi:hypothetical protein